MTPILQLQIRCLWYKAKREQERLETGMGVAPGVMAGLWPLRLRSLTWRFLRLRARFHSNSGGILCIFRHPTLPKAVNIPTQNPVAYSLPFISIDGAKISNPTN